MKFLLKNNVLNSLLWCCLFLHFPLAWTLLINFLDKYNCCFRHDETAENNKKYSTLSRTFYCKLTMRRRSFNLRSFNNENALHKPSKTPAANFCSVEWYFKQSSCTVRSGQVLWTDSFFIFNCWLCFKKAFNGNILLKKLSHMLLYIRRNRFIFINYYHS